MIEFPLTYGMFYLIVLTKIHTTSALWSTGNTHKYQQSNVYLYQCKKYNYGFRTITPYIFIFVFTGNCLVWQSWQQCGCLNNQTGYWRLTSSGGKIVFNTIIINKFHYWYGYIVWMRKADYHAKFGLSWYYHYWKTPYCARYYYSKSCRL